MVTRRIVNAILLFTGLTIVVLCGVLFRQCFLLINGNLGADTLLAQTLLRDVIRQVASQSPNGINPSDVSGPLYSRVFFYSLTGLALIGIAVWRHFTQSRSDSSHAITDI